MILMGLRSLTPRKPNKKGHWPDVLTPHYKLIKVKVHKNITINFKTYFINLNSNLYIYIYTYYCFLYIYFFLESSQAVVQ